MSTHTNENDPAFPGPFKAEPGLTAREHAAISLRVPMSGNPWLDEMIIEARRWDAAQAAMAAMLPTEGYDPRNKGAEPELEDISVCAKMATDALTRQMKGGER
jgi:hypothetical protein